MTGAGPQLVTLGSANPVKRRAVELALRRLLGPAAPRVVCLDVDPGVRSQPWGDHETRLGAGNRARAALARAEQPTATLGVGLEGGVSDEDGCLWAFSWAVVVSGSESAAARSAAFALPEPIAALVQDGLELGDAMDRTFGVVGTKRDQGAVGLLTGGALDRAGLYAQPVLLALAALLQPWSAAGAQR